MRNYIIGFSIFIAVLFVVALAIGQSDSTSDDLEYPAEFFVSEETIEESSEAEEVEVEEPSIISPSIDSAAIEIPKSTKSIPEQILVRVNYTTSYNKETKCPNWVAWHLLHDKTTGPFRRDGVPYYDENGKVYGIGIVTTETARGNYITDMEAESPRQEIIDWDDKIPNNSHGHICPAADNRWSKTAMNQSFLLTNMCPQDRDLNQGDWAGLEDRCRTWAKKYGEIYIVAGPVFYNGIKKTMGTNKVGVPDAFFKVVLCLGREPKALGFIFPNNSIHHELNEYVKSVDEVEEITGFDFFYNLKDETENSIETSSELNRW